MQYAASDIHGCYDKYVQLLRRIDLKASDTLYVLGDMIDRGCVSGGPLGRLCLDTLEEIYI